MLMKLTPDPNKSNFRQVGFKAKKGNLFSPQAKIKTFWPFGPHFQSKNSFKLYFTYMKYKDSTVVTKLLHWPDI